MPNSSKVCCDTNVVLRLLTNELSSRWVDEWRAAVQTGTTLIAPLLYRYEATNAIHRAQAAGAILAREADVLLTSMLAMPIELVSDLDIHKRAMETARTFSLAAAYDAHFLVVAQDAGAVFWTADKRLFNSVGQRLPWVRLVE